jgi:hypothetical protein
MGIDLNDNFITHNIDSKNYDEDGKLQKKLIIDDMKLVF